MTAPTAEIIAKLAAQHTDAATPCDAKVAIEGLTPTDVENVARDAGVAAARAAIDAAPTTDPLAAPSSGGSDVYKEICEGAKALAEAIQGAFPDRLAGRWAGDVLGWLATAEADEAEIVAVVKILARLVAFFAPNSLVGKLAASMLAHIAANS